MTRQIVLDTETTGLRPEEGHRIIEIGAIEIIDRRLTSNDRHFYINPERPIDEGAFKVHGISTQFLSDKPVFATIADEFLDYIQGAELIIHNAPFDLNFLDHEYRWYNQHHSRISDLCGIIDTLAMARKRHAGQRNSLDALCKRYEVNNTHRQLHGARLDALLLAEVFLRMTGGQNSLFENQIIVNTTKKPPETSQANAEKKQSNIHVILASDDEQLSHEQYLEKMQKKGACLWRNSPLSEIKNVQ
jgi:DNA polymerase-3 subunit epsilon